MKRGIVRTSVKTFLSLCFIEVLLNVKIIRLYRKSSKERDKINRTKNRRNKARKTICSHRFRIMANNFSISNATIHVHPANPIHESCLNSELVRLWFYNVRLTSYTVLSHVSGTVVTRSKRSLATRKWWTLPCTLNRKCPFREWI